MLFITSQRRRPFLFFLFLLLAAISLFAFLSTNNSPTNLTNHLPTRTNIQPATLTATPPAQIRPPTATLSQPQPTTQHALTTPSPTTESQSSLTPTTQITIPPTSERIQTHAIQSGESIDSIAVQYGITAASIIALNYLAEPDQLIPGQTLLIPLYPKPTPEPDILNSTINAALAISGPYPTLLGYSVLERPIELYTFGSGPNTLIFIGGLHGGYEWNSTVLAYEFIDYFIEEPTAVPETVTLHIIPAANPDGIFAATGKTGVISPTDVIISDTFPARFNANGVDLNRNWGCEWAPTAVWWDEIISGGAAPYSEVENQILLAFIQSQQANLQGVIFWHSSAFLISPGQCGDAPHQPSEALAHAFALASGYPVGSFDAYPITGEASNALAQLGIPSFSIELFSHEALDWNRNLAGIQALFALYDQE
jgi:LysM repeat protein